MLTYMKSAVHHTIQDVLCVVTYQSRSCETSYVLEIKDCCVSTDKGLLMWDVLFFVREWLGIVKC